MSTLRRSARMAPEDVLCEAHLSLSYLKFLEFHQQLIKDNKEIKSATT